MPSPKIPIRCKNRPNVQIVSQAFQPIRTVPPPPPGLHMPAPPIDAPPMIDIRGLYKSFGTRKIFTGLDLHIEKGETHVVIGRSGEGKSVLLKHIIGLMIPDAGEIRIEGEILDYRQPKSVEQIRQRVGMLFQGAALFDSLNVAENVGFSLREHLYWDNRRIARRVEECLQAVNLPGIGSKLPAELSGGMKKRVGLARVLASQPQVVLYDEPTTGLDPINSDVINDLIIKMRDEHGVTGVVITHDIHSAYKVADRISMFYKGIIIFTGTPEEARRTDNPYVRQFLEGRSHGPVELMPYSHIASFSEVVE